MTGLPGISGSPGKSVSRRGLLRAGAGLAAIVVAGKAPAALVKSMLAARNALLSGGAKLPYARQVEYLEFTGSQYILTGLTQYRGLTVQAEMAWMAVSNNATFVGGRSGTSTRNYYLYQTNGVWAIVYGAYTTYNSSVPVVVDDFVSVEAILNPGRQKFSINGVELFTSTDSSNTQYAQNVAIGALRVGASNITPCKAKVKWIKFYTGSVFLRDFIPVIDRNGVACMYDKVSGEMFYNAGTGAFLTPAAGGGGYKRKCVKRSHRRSLRPSARSCWHSAYRRAA